MLTALLGALAIGGSLLVVGLVAAAAAVPYAAIRQVDWRNVAWFGLPGMAGAWIGATLAHWVPGAVQLALFAAVMLLAAWRMLLGGVANRPDHEPRRLAVVTGGIGVGALSGLVGVGGGFLVVPALVLLAVAGIGVIGSFAGHRLGRRLPQATLRRLFGLFLVAMGLYIAVDVGPRLLG